MKKWIHFASKGFSSLQFHGLSIPGGYSLRLSNIPKNLKSMSHWVFSLSQHSSILLLSTLLSLIKTVQTQEVCEISNSSTLDEIYLDHSDQNTHLLIRYNKKFPLAEILNGTCYFFLGKKLSNSYNLSACICQTDINEFNIIIHSQNLNSTLLNCIKDFFETYCNQIENISSTMSLSSNQITILITILLAMLSFLAYCTRAWLDRCCINISNCCNLLYNCAASSSDYCLTTLSNCKEAIFSLNRRREEKLITRNNTINIENPQPYNLILR